MGSFYFIFQSFVKLNVIFFQIKDATFLEGSSILSKNKTKQKTPLVLGSLY